MTDDIENQLNFKRKVVGNYLPAILSFCGLVGIDQFIKYLVDTKMELYSSIEIWKNVFEIHYIQNTGAAWGLFENKQILFVLCTLIVMIFGILIFVKCVNKNIFKDIRILIILILAGAMGNMIDRIRYHYVIDFLYFKLINFPVFNIADCYVTVGFGLLLILLLFKYKDEDFDKLK